MALCSEPAGHCSNYFGKTYTGIEWLSYGQELGNVYFPITTNDVGFWEGEVGFMADKEDSGYKGSGEYTLKARYYTSSGKTASSWSEPVFLSLIDTTPVADINPDIESVISDDITHIRQLPKGSKISTEGRITVAPGTFGSDTFYIEDDFSGIKVDLPKGFEHSLKLGDEVRVSCTLEESRGEKYIKVDDTSKIEILKTNLACKSPSSIGTGQRLDDYEGRLVRVEGEVVETSGDTFYINDGSGRVKIYIRESTGINKPAMRRGDKAFITGIVSQWGQHSDGSDNYRVMPRFAEDVALEVKENSELGGVSDTEEEGKVLGAITELPETGSNCLILYGYIVMLLSYTILRLNSKTVKSTKNITNIIPSRRVILYSVRKNRVKSNIEITRKAPELYTTSGAVRVIGEIIAVRPKVNPALKIIAPKRSPIIISPFFLIAALMPKKSSGREVPSATIKSPTNTIGIPRLVAVFSAVFTNTLELKSRRNNPKAVITI